MARDSVTNTLLVATSLCVVCSVLVASAAVGLRGRQEANKRLDRKKNVLLAAGLFDQDQHTSSDVSAIFDDRVEAVLIDLATGAPVDTGQVDIESYDQREAADDSKQNVAIEPANALEGIDHREPYAFVYEVKNESGAIEQVVLPMYGKGLWSTMYGFIAVGANGSTIEGITFYEHGETPGLGGEIENKRWQKGWAGKQLLNKQGEIAIRVTRGAVDAKSPNAQHEIDGLSGATITGNGVSELVRYWIGDHAFGPYLKKLRESSTEEGANG